MTKVKVEKTQSGWDVARSDWHLCQNEDKSWNYNLITDIEPVGIDMQYCKMDLVKWVALAKKQCTARNISQNEIQNIMKRVTLDISCRKNGKKIAAKFAGKDAVTGRKYEAGTEIYYNFNSGASVIA